MSLPVVAIALAVISLQCAVRWRLFLRAGGVLARHCGGGQHHTIFARLDLSRVWS